MLNEVDGAYVAAQIRLLRQVQKGTILLLEGGTDAKALDRFIDGSTCEIEIAGGKANVIEALDLLEDEGFGGVVGVVDADFDHLNGVQYSLENLCVTDVHDLDLMIFRSSAFDRYVAEHGNTKRIEKEFQGDLSLVRSKILDCCRPLAYCRFVSDRRGMRLRFSGLKLDDLVDHDLLTMDRTALITTIISRSSARITEAALCKHVENEESKLHDPYQLTSGHDAARVMGVALRKLIGERRDVHTWGSEIEAGLRLSLDWDAISGTGLYRCLRAWEARNPPYRIFRQ